MNAKYNFIEMLETMSEKDLEYIQSTFDTGEMISKDKKYTYERTNLIDEGFFIYAIFEWKI